MHDNEVRSDAHAPALIALPYCWDTAPAMVAQSGVTIAAVLSDVLW